MENKDASGMRVTERKHGATFPARVTRVITTEVRLLSLSLEVRLKVYLDRIN